jgi:hypothetical protein
MRKKKKSKLWTQTSIDVEKNPYDYKSQEPFLTVALGVLDEAFGSYAKLQLKYHLDDRSVQKAIWMLHLDALDTLRDCVFLLKHKKHRLVGKMFRDITESLDRAALFWDERDGNRKNLNNWYENEVVVHGKFRNHLLKTKKFYETDIKDESFADYSNTMHRNLSKWTHHCYRVLIHSYSLAGKSGKQLVYQGHLEFLLSPDLFSWYLLEIRDLIFYFLGNVKTVKLINWDKLKRRLNKIVVGFVFV